ncbi:MAG: hypothetical protein WC335_06895 [Candidatus Omnitrophota bacterium]|jgi:hypothetical protein
MDFKKVCSGLVISVLVLSVMSACIYAQSQGPDQRSERRAPSASDMIAGMKADLNLSDQQVSQITPIMENEIKQMEALRGQEGDREAGRTQMEAIRKETETMLAQYLTPEQLAKWKSRKPPQPGQPGNGSERMEPPPSGGMSGQMSGQDNSQQ